MSLRAGSGLILPWSTFGSRFRGNALYPDGSICSILSSHRRQGWIALDTTNTKAAHAHNTALKL
jgi:hypothetical protein